MLKTKLKAFIIHLLLSIILVSFVIGMIIYFWYPAKYWGVTSLKDIAILIISIDLILGPLLTFVIYNPTKKSLRFDLSVIALFQISALAYGSYTLFQTHPVYITYSVNGFSLVNANEAQPAKANFEEYNVSKLSSAKLAYAELPADDDVQTKLIVSIALEGAPGLEKRMEYYKPYKSNIDKILSQSLDSDKIFSDPKLKKYLEPFLDKKKSINNLAFFPIKGSGKSAIVILDKTTAEPIALINSYPWKYVKK